MEISCVHAGRGLHLLAYLLDPAHPPLVDALSRVLRARDDRMPRICAALRAAGIPIRDEDVRAVAGEATAIGRPHIADQLIRLGVVASRDEAFERLLSPGRPGHVPRYAPPVEQVLPLVTAAGGVSVIAHPWGRAVTTALQREELASLRDQGLSGVEVDHEDHTPDQREELRGLARELDLVVTGSSDFHGTNKPVRLGACLTAPDQYEQLTAGRFAGPVTGS
jgi:predicted metal-dependent phosphoesterase TrpH